jgi:tetratricopeptide (TPR) repeat protein
MRRIASILLAAALLGLCAVPGHAAHPHYLRLLREGTFALERGNTEQAARDLRIACFGLLEEPPLLGECLVYLGLAQAREDDDAHFQQTFRRLLEVEQRFRAYRSAHLPREIRAAFEQQVAARVPPRILEQSETFSALVPAASDGTEPPTTGGASTPPLPGRETENGSVSPAGPGSPSAEESPDELTPDDREKLATARDLLAKAQRRRDLDEPYRLAREVASARPGAREAQYLAATIAYRSERWQEAVSYFRLGGDPGPDRPELLFYLAVSLYETGDRAGAADALRRSLPRLTVTPFVRSYREKILGPEESG